MDIFLSTYAITLSLTESIIMDTCDVVLTFASVDKINFNSFIILTKHHDDIISFYSAKILDPRINFHNKTFSVVGSSWPAPR